MQKKDSQPTAISRRSFLLSGLFVLGESSLILHGCAPGRTSKECMELYSGEEQMECLYKQLFPTVARGVIVGAFAGAVLGGAVAFATGDSVSAGLAIGGIIGGVAGGVLAYYNFTLERANYDHNRAISDIYQDIRAEFNKLQRVVIASTQAFNETRNLFEKRITTLEQRVEKIQQLRTTIIINFSDVGEVHHQVLNNHLEKATGNILKMQNKIFNLLDKTNRTINDIAQQLQETRELIVKGRS